jgi:hypothetical protein
MYVNPGTFQRCGDTKTGLVQHGLPESPKLRNCLRIRKGGQDRPQSLRELGGGNFSQGNMREIGKFPPIMPIRA